MRIVIVIGASEQYQVVTQVGRGFGEVHWWSGKPGFHWTCRRFLTGDLEVVGCLSTAALAWWSSAGVPLNIQASMRWRPSVNSRDTLHGFRNPTTNCDPNRDIASPRVWPWPCLCHAAGAEPGELAEAGQLEQVERPAAIRRSRWLGRPRSRSASVLAYLHVAFEAAMLGRLDGVFNAANTLLQPARVQLAELALRHRVASYGN